MERWWPKGTKEGERGGEWFAPSFLRLMTRIRASGLVSGKDTLVWSPPASPVSGSVARLCGLRLRERFTSSRADGSQPMQ